MATGSLNVSTNTKMDNEIEELQNKDVELENTLNSKADNNDIAIKSISGKSTITITDSRDSTVIINDAQRNLFPINFATTTNYGVTYTKNDDGSITMNGTSTGTTWGLFIGSVTLPPGRYLLSDITFPEYGHGSIYITGHNGDTSTWHNRTPFTLTITSNINMWIYTAANVTIDNVTIYPTILKNQENYPTVYVPYTGYDIVSSNSDGSKTSKISITPDTVFPISGLKCYDGETIITNDYDLDMSISYPTNIVGCSIMNMIGTTDISNVGDGTITGAISALKAQIDAI